jgi:hypothetical protein
MFLKAYIAPFEVGPGFALIRHENRGGGPDFAISTYFCRGCWSSLPAITNRPSSFAPTASSNVLTNRRRGQKVKKSGLANLDR